MRIPTCPMVAPSVESGSPPPADYSSKNPKAVYSALLDKSRTFLWSVSRVSGTSCQSRAACAGAVGVGMSTTPPLSVAL